MKLFTAALSCLFLNCVQGAAIPQLPETAATVDGVPLSSAEIKKSWHEVTAALPENVQPETLERIFRGLTEKYIWQYEIKQMLAEAGIKADRNTAEKYFDLQQKKYRISPSILSSAQLNSLLDSPRFQLKSAIYIYLASIVPEKIRITRSEVAELYRSMPEKFKVPGKEHWGIIEVSDHSSAKQVRALLLQGSSFEAIARRFSPRGMQSPLPAQLADIGTTIKINGITPVIKSEKGWIVAKLISREKSTMIPLEKVYGQLAASLADSKEAAALTEVLRKRLSGRKIIYAPLNRQKTKQ